MMDDWVSFNSVLIWESILTLNLSTPEREVVLTCTSSYPDSILTLRARVKSNTTINILINVDYKN